MSGAELSSAETAALKRWRRNDVAEIASPPLFFAPGNMEASQDNYMLALADWKSSDHRSNIHRFT